MNDFKLHISILHKNVKINYPKKVLVNKTISMLHSGNIAHRLGRTIYCNPLNGKIIYDPEAMQLWKREYEPGW